MSAIKISLEQAVVSFLNDMICPDPSFIVAAPLVQEDEPLPLLTVPGEPIIEDASYLDQCLDLLKTDDRAYVLIVVNEGDSDQPTRAEQRLVDIADSRDHRVSMVLEVWGDKLYIRDEIYSVKQVRETLPEQLLRHHTELRAWSRSGVPDFTPVATAPEAPELRDFLPRLQELAATGKKPSPELIADCAAIAGHSLLTRDAILLTAVTESLDHLDSEQLDAAKQMFEPGHRPGPHARGFMLLLAYTAAHAEGKGAAHLHAISAAIAWWCGASYFAERQVKLTQAIEPDNTMAELVGVMLERDLGPAWMEAQGY